MLPFVERQLIYWALSGLTTLIAWWLLGHSPRLADSVRWRAVSTAVLLAVPTVFWMLGCRLFDHWHSTFQFIGVAHGFYVGFFWLPVTALVWSWLGDRDVLAIIASLALLGVGGWSLFGEPNRLVVVRESVAVEAWSEHAEPLRLVHVSDLQTVGPCARNRRAAELINGLDPDVIIVTGDYVAGPFPADGSHRPALEEAQRFLAELEPELALICIAGHSENESQRLEIFEGLELTYLTNDELELDLGYGRRLRVFGLTALDADLEAFEVRSERGLATLFASHVPDVSGELDGLGVDLHLAGHTHGGQVTLPFLGAPFTLSELPSRYARGLHRFGDHWLNVNPGIGMEGNHAPRFRFRCPPQIDLIVLEGAGSGV